MGACGVESFIVTYTVISAAIIAHKKAGLTHPYIRHSIFDKIEPQRRDLLPTEQHIVFLFLCFFLGACFIKMGVGVLECVWVGGQR